MIMVCHHLNPDIPSDVAFAESRVRAETIAAENVLHDMGVISHVLLATRRRWAASARTGSALIQTADAHEERHAASCPRTPPATTISACCATSRRSRSTRRSRTGIADVVGSVEPGKMADLVLWEPAFFGAKPKLVIKGGMINWALMGDPNASLPTPQPVLLPARCSAPSARRWPKTCITFVSQAGYDAGVARALGLQRQVLPVERRARSASRTWSAIRHADDRGRPGDFRGHGRRRARTVAPLKTISLNQLYFFS